VLAADLFQTLRPVAYVLALLLVVGIAVFVAGHIYVWGHDRRQLELAVHKLELWRNADAAFDWATITVLRHELGNIHTSVIRHAEETNLLRTAVETAHSAHDDAASEMLGPRSAATTADPSGPLRPFGLKWSERSRNLGYEIIDPNDLGPFGEALRAAGILISGHRPEMNESPFETFSGILQFLDAFDSALEENTRVPARPATWEEVQKHFAASRSSNRPETDDAAAGGTEGLGTTST
jgi:hypothetical protein